MSEIDFFAIMIADQFQRIFENGHHSESEQIDFDDAHVRAIVFVPLHDRAARHRRRLQRHDRIQLTLTNHHAAGMLAKMPRQILEAQAQLEEFANARMAHIEAGHAELGFERVGFDPCIPKS